MLSNKICLIALLALLLPLWLVPSASASESAQKLITVVFRYDDYSSKSATDLDIKIIDAFRRYNLTSTFGVIPYVADRDTHDPSLQGVIPLNHDKAVILKDALENNIIEVGLHGYSHQTRLTLSEGGYTEFVGLDYESQKQKIADGKDLLEEMLDISIATFIPPWNRYDQTTIQVLEELNFNTISAGAGGTAGNPSRLNYLPVTVEIPELQDTVRAARKSRDARPVIGVLFHPYDFRETGSDKSVVDLQEFNDLLKWLTLQKDVRILTVDGATKTIDGLDSELYRQFTELVTSPLYVLTPTFLVPRLKYYPSATTINDTKVREWLFSTLYYLVVLIISATVAFFAGLIVFRRLRFLDIIGRYGGLLLLALYSVYALHDLTIGLRGATILTVILGICGGIWLASIRINKSSRSKPVQESI